ncbi:MAG: hypothetical protein EBS32_07770, partial [Actinobacteria bacterium]|nr:hypothetical protein [Actinomycetota bacterium]
DRVLAAVDGEGERDGAACGRMHEHVGALARVRDAPEVKTRIAQLGGEVQKGGSKAAQDFIQAQMALWARVVKGKGIVLE